MRRASLRTRVIPAQGMGDLHMRRMPRRSNQVPGQELHRRWRRGRWNFTVFNTTLANLLLVTRYSPGMFDRFANKVIAFEEKTEYPDEKEKVKHELDEFLHGLRLWGNHGV